MQRIILLVVFFCCKIMAMPYAGYVSFKVIDTLTGVLEKVFLVSGEQSLTVSKKFMLKIHSIKTDDNYPEITWVDADIYYKCFDNDDYQCIQKGLMNTSQIYRFSDEQYILAFDLSDQIDESVFAEN